MSSLLYGDPSLQNRDIEQKSYRKDVPINEFYEIERTCSWIKEHNYKNVNISLIYIFIFFFKINIIYYT